MYTMIVLSTKFLSRVCIRRFAIAVDIIGIKPFKRGLTESAFQAEAMLSI